MKENSLIGGEPVQEQNPEKASPVKTNKTSGLNSWIDSFLNLISSVPFGISLLILLITACMIGMVIQQQELESFSGYYAELTPGEKIIYGRLGFFNIYHAWYFNLLLLLLSLNIILASIDHFPAAWSYISRKKLTASPTFASTQKFREKVEVPQLDRKQLTERAVKAAKHLRFKVRVTEEDARTTVFCRAGRLEPAWSLRRACRPADNLCRRVPDQPRIHRKPAGRPRSVGKQDVSGGLQPGECDKPIRHRLSRFEASLHHRGCRH
ncbi:MAG: cytochrome c biogenesis protein ResB [Acidobacteria bacterium]|nr:cytochrome c biogenesis protein ResB [Acidobacteriota bacterium]